MSPKLLVKRNARLIERSGIGEHADEAGVLRVDVGEHQHRLRAELRGDASVLRPRPHREVEDDRVDSLGGHAAAVSHGNVVLPDDLVAGDDVEPVGLETSDELLAELPIDRLERPLQEMPSVTEVEDTDADLARLKVSEHDSPDWRLTDDQLTTGDDPKTVSYSHAAMAIGVFRMATPGAR